MPECGIERGDHEGVRGWNSEHDRIPDERVQVPVVSDVLGLAVVRAEGDPAGAELLHEGQKGMKVSSGGRLADQEPQAGAEPLRPSSAVDASWSERMPAAA